ncbi:fibronectin type III domain-containing protein [Flavobacterium piscisymbiosum]|uniref:Fibronectin type III domain-containing protein n=1 Tax=Flavobacterium piscisymbiosum TaxID=2893753 RepID=A0ABS8MDG8_9FLAO|nr:fibronectin type III domain-containing protein [Flavobacterium sp. F-30]MCC9063561.1 fibronectin type III domain-containing protein [Flavobacterium sp. F-30]
MDKYQLPKMLKKLHLYLLILCALIGFEGYAQTYPISITTQLTQPSPIYLNNYANATTINSPIKIQLVLNDLTISNRQVKLKIYFQGNGITFNTNDFVVGARPLYLEGGFPLQLTNVDLAPYFEYQNLLGVNPNQYAQPLPEGIYNIYVEVYDFATGKKLSSKTRTNTIIFQNEPPFLNLPLNNASIMHQNIQNIIFSWTPRSINVSNVEYEFSLVEIWDKYTPIQNAFAYSPPLYTKTTRATTLQYSINEPQLIPGKKYAWRIKAKAILGAEEIGVFKNNGYSEIFSFDYEISCTPPLAITTSGVSENQAKIAWSGNIDNYDYQVNYREKNANSEWYKQVTPRENITISNLKPNTVYEYTVGSSCDPGKYTHSTIKEFTTVARDEIAFEGCGIKPDPNDLGNTTPLPNLYQNDVVTAGDFPIVVIKATGSNGNFSGEGYVTLPFIEKFRKLIDAADNLKDIANKGAEITGKVGAAANASANLASNTATKVSNRLDNPTGDSIENSAGKIKDKVADVGTKVNEKAGEIAGDISKYSTNIGEHTRIRITFNNIGINTDFKLISGEIIASYDPTWKNIANLDGAFDEVFGSNGKPIEGKFDYEVVSVVLNADGSTTVTGKDGQISTIAKSPYERVYTDSTGKVVTIPANGVGAPVIANAAAGGKATAANTNGMSASGDVVKITSPDVKITFKNGEKSQYAFDVLPDSGSQKLKDTYETIPMESGGIYNVNYKAVSDLNGPETFIAEAEFKNGKTIKDVVFKTNAGADVNFKWNDSNTEAIITVTKTLNFSKESIIAIVKGATQKDPQDLAKTIEGKSDIAGKVNLWQLAQKPVINVTILSVNGANAPSADNAKDFLNEVYNKVGIKFDVTAQDLTIGSLPAAIQCGDSGLINFYSNGQIDIKNQIEANPNFTYNSETYYVIYTGKPGQDGYKGFMPLGGQYAFVFSDGDLKTAAHELGHGIFGLKHPFATKGESGKTDLLMDYGTGTVLSHNDWDIIHSGGWKFYGFQSSSSGALAGGFGLSPKWEFISNGDEKTVANINLAGKGFLGGFVTNKGETKVTYAWAADKYIGDDNTSIITQTTKPVVDKSKIYLFYDNDKSCPNSKYLRTIYNKELESIIKAKDEKLLSKYIDRYNKSEYYVKDKETRSIYWGYLGCSTSNTGNGTGASSDEERLKDLISKLDIKIGDDSVAAEFIILDKNDPKYKEKLAEALKKVSYILATYDSTGKETLKLEYKLQIPKAIQDLFPNFKTSDNCMVDYINSSLATLHGNFIYKNMRPSDQALVEIATVFYQGFFGMWYCATNEESIANSNGFDQYLAGATHEAIAMIDVVLLVDGLATLAKEGLKVKVQSYVKYYENLKSINTTINKGGEIQPEQILGVVLIPPYNTLSDNIKKVVKIGNEFKKTYFTECNETKLKNGKTADICYYRYGQLTVMIFPILYTAGEYAVAKISQIAKLSKVSVSLAENAIKLNEKLIAKGVYLLEADGKTIIKNATTGEIIAVEGTAITDIEKALDNLSDFSGGGKVISLLDDIPVKGTPNSAGIYIEDVSTPIIQMNYEGNVISNSGFQNYSFEGNAARQLENVTNLTIVKEGKVIKMPQTDILTKHIPEVKNVPVIQLVPYNLTYYKGAQGSVELIVAETESVKGVVQVVYASAVVAKKIKEEEEKKQKCTICKERIENTTNSQLCLNLRRLQTNTNNLSAISKLCGITDLNNFVIKLLEFDIPNQKEFLKDIDESNGSDYICGNISKFDLDILKAWKLVQDARPNLQYRKDWAVLQEIKTILNNSNSLSTIGEIDGLKTIIQKNVSAPCKVCSSGNSDYIMLNNYLNYVNYFAINYKGAPGFDDVIGKKGILSGGIHQVNATAFVLRVLKENPSYIGTITGFELKIEVVNDANEKNTAFADVIENGNKIVECKSWKIDGLAFLNFVKDQTTITGSSKQFITYLSDASKVTSLDKLEYWFDSMKFNKNKDPQPIKEKFKQMLLNANNLSNKGEATFNAIWSNIPLRGSLFPQNKNEDDRDDAKDDFKELIKDTKSRFYNFITVK